MHENPSRFHGRGYYEQQLSEGLVIKCVKAIEAYYICPGQDDQRWERMLSNIFFKNHDFQSPEVKNNV